MRTIFTDIKDELKCIELTPKGWNYVATALLVAAGLYWIIGSDYGDFFKLTGFAVYIASAVLWAKKSAWGQKLMEDMFDDDDIVPFEDEEE